MLLKTISRPARTLHNDSIRIAFGKQQRRGIRCEGHLFTTIWVPGVSFKAVRLGTGRSQWCPIGRHWTTVSRVPESELTQEDIQSAHEHHDIRIP